MVFSLFLISLRFFFVCEWINNLTFWFYSRLVLYNLSVIGVLKNSNRSKFYKGKHFFERKFCAIFNCCLFVWKRISIIFSLFVIREKNEFDACAFDTNKNFCSLASFLITFKTLNSQTLQVFFSSSFFTWKGSSNISLLEHSYSQKMCIYTHKESAIKICRIKNIEIGIDQTDLRR